MTKNIFLNMKKELAIRIAYIDFKVRFTGVLTRKDIMNEFNISDVTTTEILKEYNKISNGNIIYDTKNKVFHISDSYIPLFELDGEKALSMLTDGFDRFFLFGGNVEIKPYFPFIKNENLNVDFIATITRAIYNRKKVEIIYSSNFSGKKDKRLISPLTIIKSQSDWIFRAYDESSHRLEKYSNFNFSRINEVKETDIDMLDFVNLNNDRLWNLEVDLIIEIKEEITEKGKDIIRLEMMMGAMENKKIIKSRAALAWLVLHNLDTEFTSHNFNNHTFKLVNDEELVRIGLFSV